MYVNSKEDVVKTLFHLHANAIMENFNLSEDKIFDADDAIKLIGVEAIFQFLFKQIKEDYDKAQKYIFDTNNVQTKDRFVLAKKKLQLHQGQILADLYWPRLMACYRVMHQDNGVNYSFIQEGTADARKRRAIFYKNEIE